jgi:gluconolactonase
MQRRTFMNLTASTATALALHPLARAAEHTQKTPVLYPDPAVEVIDPRFAKYKVGNAAVERLYTGTRWAEGPVWFGDGHYLLFSDIPNNRILRWLEDTGEVSVFRNPSNYSNGNFRDRQGRLLTCEHDSRRLTRTEYDGTITVLMDGYQGKKLNAPNDLAVHSDGAIWFTDPGYGIMSNYEGHKATFELPANVYRLDPKTREVTVVASDMDKPNGLCFSPDEKLLYIVDTGVPKRPTDPHQIRVYDVVDGVRLKNGRMFVDMSPGNSDGREKATTACTSSPRTQRSSAKFIFPRAARTSASAAPRKTVSSWPPASLSTPCTWGPKARRRPDDAITGRKIACIRVFNRGKLCGINESSPRTPSRSPPGRIAALHPA